MKLTTLQKHGLVLLVGVFTVVFGADALRTLLYPPPPVDFSALQVAFQERHRAIVNDADDAFPALPTGDAAGREVAHLSAATSATAAAASDSLTEKIPINTATLRQLQRLPRIGPAIAARILRYRTEHGPFLTVEDLTNVKGIGPKTLERIRPFVVITP